MRHAPFALLSVISLFTILAIASQAHAATKRDWVFDGAEIGRIHLELDAATVSLRGTDGALLRVTVAQKELSERCETRVEKSGGDVEVELDIDADADDCAFRVEVSVPKGTAVDLDSGAGSVRIDRLDARLSVVLGAGNISGSVLAAGIDVETGAGNIDLKVSAAPMEAHTGAGNIELQFLKTPNGEVEVSSGVGNVIVRLPKRSPVEVDLTSGLGRVRNDVGSWESAATQIEATTGIGNVSLEVEVEG